MDITERDIDRGYSPLLRYSSVGFDEDVRARSQQNDTDTHEQERQYVTQVIAVMVACLCVMSAGMTLSYTSPALADMHDEGIIDDDNRASWFSSIVNIGAIAGGPIAGQLVNKLGRKLTIMLVAVPYTLGCFITISTTRYPVLLAGRVMTGVAVGMTSLCVPIYIAETSSKNIRGALGAAFQLISTVGVVFMYSLGVALSWRWLGVVIAVPPSIMILFMTFMAESPRWLLSQNREDDASKALSWLRRPQYDQVQMTELQIQNKESFPLAGILVTPIRRLLLISVGLMFFQQCSGINAVVFNTNEIFQNAGFAGDSSLPTVITGLVQLATGIASCVLIDKAGRRVLLMASGILLTLSSVTFGLFYYLNQVHHMDNIKWLSLTSVTVYMIGFFLGWGPIPWLTMGELFPVDRKSVV